MGFEFRKQDSVEICGRRYALDISSPGVYRGSYRGLRGNFIEV